MKKLSVNKEACIGCGACQAICDDVYEINDEGFAEVKKEINFETLEENIQNDAIAALENCPTSAIFLEEK